MSDYSGEKFVDIVFDGPPSHESGRFVEVEDVGGRSMRFGEWLERADGSWALRLLESDFTGKQHYCSLCDVPRPNFRLLSRLKEHVAEAHPGFEVRRPVPVIGGWR